MLIILINSNIIIFKLIANENFIQKLQKEMFFTNYKDHMYILKSKKIYCIVFMIFLNFYIIHTQIFG